MATPAGREAEGGSADAERDMTSEHVGRAAAGDLDSIAWLIDRLTPLLVLQVDHRLTPSLRRLYDAEDIVNDAWCDAIPKLGGIKPYDGSRSVAVLKYLSTAVLNRLRRLAERVLTGMPPEKVGNRARTIDPDDGFSALSAHVTGVVTRCLRSELRSRVRAMIDELDPPDREIVILAGIEQRPYPEIATFLGIRQNLVAVRYHRALQRLRTSLPNSAFADLIPAGAS